jgi:hypothetical protein
MCIEQWDGHNSELPLHKQVLAQLDNGQLLMNNILYSRQWADDGTLKGVCRDNLVLRYKYSYVHWLNLLLWKPVSVYLSIHPSIHPPTDLLVSPPTDRSVHLHAHWYVARMTDCKVATNYPTISLRTAGYPFSEVAFQIYNTHKYIHSHTVHRRMKQHSTVGFGNILCSLWGTKWILYKR